MPECDNKIQTSINVMSASHTSLENKSRYLEDFNTRMLNFRGGGDKLKSCRFYNFTMGQHTDLQAKKKIV